MRSGGEDMGNCDGGSNNSGASGNARPSLVVVPEGGLWTAADVAAYLSLSVDWVWKQVRCNSGLPFIRLGRNVRFDPDKVKAWLAAQPQGGKQ